MKTSSLQLKEYFFPEVHVRANPNYVFDPSTRFVVPVLENTVWISDDAGADLCLAVTITKEITGAEDPYELRIAAFATIAHDLDLTDLARRSDGTESLRKIAFNGFQMLFGAARELVSSVTGRGPWNAALLRLIVLDVEDLTIIPTKNWPGNAPSATKPRARVAKAPTAE